jgi:carboxyl-terminal processing protease
MTVVDENNRERALELPRTVTFQDRAHLGRAKLEYGLPAARVGYIWFDGWAFDLKSKLEPALKDLWHTQGLIIDLRQNRGGVNPGVDYLASVLVAGPGTLASVTRRNGEKADWEFPGGAGEVYKERIAILIDEGSGSASEVFAGAMQEMGRAIVLGSTSYGGVLNSTQAQLPTGGILQYPHSDLRTPKGRRIEGQGVVPDISVELLRKDLLAGKDTVVERAVRTILD